MLISAAWVPGSTWRDIGINRFGGLWKRRGDFASDITVCEYGVFDMPFLAHYALRLPNWPHPLLLFINSQSTSGSAENAVLRFLWNLESYKRLPGIILLLGDRWEKADASAHVEWTRQHAQPYLLHVFLGLAEFRTWIAAGMPWPESRQRTFG